MKDSTFQLVGRRSDRPESLLFRDRKGRHFLRTSCGSRLVRITTKDADRIVRQYAYNSVLDGAWRSELEASGLECLLSFETESPGLHPR
jgi:hypothetical protein